ncbi:MAG TPA: hypothetical protein VNZ58_01165 [Thermomicrobiales bacterium]|nr:hypothetical protein [Thermomicrobiales bacterium]
MTGQDHLFEEMNEPLGDEHDPPGESQGANARFTATDVATAFDVERNRVVAAFAGEFGFDSDATIDSMQAQRIADLLLADQPQAEQEAALMSLGAFTPRRDTIEPSVSEKAPGEVDDSLLAGEYRRRHGVSEDNR